MPNTHHDDEAPGPKFRPPSHERHMTDKERARLPLHAQAYIRELEDMIVNHQRRQWESRDDIKNASLDGIAYVLRKMERCVPERGYRFLSEDDAMMDDTIRKAMERL